MRSILAGIAVGAIFAGGLALAADVPAYISAAVADKGRPAEDVARDAARKPAEMLMFAGIKPGDKVVDLIPGKGYFTKIFAKAVGPSGHVYAFQPSELDTLYKKHNLPIPEGTDPNYPNVSYIHKSLNDVSIPEPVDVVWTSQNYHDMHDPEFGPADMAKVNKAIYAALKPGGIYIVLDHAAQPGSGTRDTDTLHRIDPAVVKQEVLAAGFEFVGEDDTLRNPNDPLTVKVFDPSIRGHTDQFIYKFRKPVR